MESGSISMKSDEQPLLTTGITYGELNEHLMRIKNIEDLMRRVKALEEWRDEHSNLEQHLEPGA